MGKSLYIAEKPSVAREFAKVLGADGNTRDGFLENADSVVTWCYGHLVTMSYPEVYDQKYKKWSLDTLPFFPENYLYEIIPSAKEQFSIVKKQLSRSDVDAVYVCTDAGREGEYIYRLVEQMCPSSVRKKERRRVWIDSQTEEEIKRGIKEAKPLSEYDSLADAAYLRAKEDYLMGINFSRLLTVKYGNRISQFRGGKWSAVAVGRVMTCVLGMVVRREREIRDFTETPFYRVLGRFESAGGPVRGFWHVTDKSAYAGSPALYRDTGFRDRKTAEELIEKLRAVDPPEGIISSYSKKTEKKNAPLLYNLAEIQNDASRLLHISPDAALNGIQELYEKKLVTYPRTDARVLSTAIAKEIGKNLSGLTRLDKAKEIAEGILSSGTYKTIAKTQYVNDKMVGDHYALIPTGEGLGNLSSVGDTGRALYDLITRRFLSVFYPPAVYRKISAEIELGTEAFTAGDRTLTEKGYLAVLEAFPVGTELRRVSRENAAGSGSDESGAERSAGQDAGPENAANDDGESGNAALTDLRKGSRLQLRSLEIREGKTSPPKRYTSGSMILAMENAGQLIEDEELRAQIKGSGIGTSATRAEILKKLFTIEYLRCSAKTQVITPTLLGEIIYDTVDRSIRPMLDPTLTASWEKGLTYVSEGSVKPEEYMDKLEGFIAKRVTAVKDLRNESALSALYEKAGSFYPERERRGGAAGRAYGGRTARRKETAQAGKHRQYPKKGENHE